MGAESVTGQLCCGKPATCQNTYRCVVRADYRNKAKNTDIQNANAHMYFPMGAFGPKAPAKSELDPNGVSAHTPGSKLDAGKNRVSLVLGGFARALEAVCRVGTFGANKYTANGWMEVPNGIERYTDAMNRHQLKEWQGELNDPDSDLMHAAHLAWNALARLDLILRAKEANK